MENEEYVEKIAQLESAHGQQEVSIVDNNDKEGVYGSMALVYLVKEKRERERTRVNCREKR